MALRKTLWSIGVMLLVVACSADGAQPVFPGSGEPGGAQSGGDDVVASPGEGAESSGDLGAAPNDAFALIAAFDYSQLEPPSLRGGDPLGGAPDTRAAAAITDDIAEQGVDLTGVEFWVWPVPGTAEHLLVMEISDTASGLLDDPTGGSVFDAILSSTAIVEAGITRLVLDYHGSDDEGDFVLTMTVAMDALRTAYVEQRDLGEDEALLQFTRNGVVVES